MTSTQTSNSEQQLYDERYPEFMLITRPASDYRKMQLGLTLVRVSGSFPVLGKVTHATLCGVSQDTWSESTPSIAGVSLRDPPDVKGSPQLATHALRTSSDGYLSRNHASPAGSLMPCNNVVRVVSEYLWLHVM